MNITSVGSPDSRIDYLTCSSPDARLSLASSNYGILPELLRMCHDVRTCKSCRSGWLPSLTRILAAVEEVMPATTVERK
ncbi:hypothetical protein QJS10_CPB11g01431 [Acorus calamus]|uniref:Uncharacterized protein n=1 Tax=Acorus calamus TaxID=4465 RepID=A0AAV9DQG9_ACOCL|nr:hypothetical protein QJS10_CPB11g01431 [Acorus calamus]